MYYYIVAGITYLAPTKAVSRKVRDERVLYVGTGPPYGYVRSLVAEVVVDPYRCGIGGLYCKVLFPGVAARVGTCIKDVAGTKVALTEEPMGNGGATYVKTLPYLTTGSVWWYRTRYRRPGNTLNKNKMKRGTAVDTSADLR